MNARDGGHLPGAAQFFDDRSSRFHAPERSDTRYVVKCARSEIANGRLKRFSLQFLMLDRWTREALDFSGISQAEMARIISEKVRREIDRAAVNKMTKGTRQVAADEMLAISEATKFPIPDPNAGPKEVVVVGLVAAGSDTVAFSEGQGNLGEVEAPDNATEQTVAVEVRGDSLGALFENSLIFYDDVRTPPSADMVGRMCVCGLDDGRVVVKSLRRGRRAGRWDLHPNLGQPIYDTKVIWAALVRNVRPTVVAAPAPKRRQPPVKRGQAQSLRDA